MMFYFLYPIHGAALAPDGRSRRLLMEEHERKISLFPTETLSRHFTGIPFCQKQSRFHWRLFGHGAYLLGLMRVVLALMTGSSAMAGHSLRGRPLPGTQLLAISVDGHGFRTERLPRHSWFASAIGGHSLRSLWAQLFACTMGGYGVRGGLRLHAVFDEPAWLQPASLKYVTQQSSMPVNSLV